VEGPSCKIQEAGGSLTFMPWLTVINGFDPRVQRIGAVCGRSNGSPRPQAPGRRRTRRSWTKWHSRPRNRAGRHLCVAGDLANLNVCLHGWGRRRPRHGVHGGERSAAGERRHSVRLGGIKKGGGEEFLTARGSFGG
jgi:hypothetical protein